VEQGGIVKYWEVIADDLSRAGGGFESQLSGDCVHEKPHHGSNHGAALLGF
jgi:hypothetical protein